MYFSSASGNTGKMQNGRFESCAKRGTQVSVPTLNTWNTQMQIK